MLLSPTFYLKAFTRSPSLAGEGPRSLMRWTTLDFPLLSFLPWSERVEVAVILPRVSHSFSITIFFCYFFLFFPPHFTNLLLVSMCTHLPHHPILRTCLIKANFLFEKHLSVNVGIILYLPEQQSSCVQNLQLVLQLLPEPVGLCLLCQN